MSRRRTRGRERLSNLYPRRERLRSEPHAVPRPCVDMILICCLHKEPLDSRKVSRGSSEHPGSVWAIKSQYDWQLICGTLILKHNAIMTKRIGQSFRLNLKIFVFLSPQGRFLFFFWWCGGGIDFLVFYWKSSLGVYLRPCGWSFMYSHTSHSQDHFQPHVHTWYKNLYHHSLSPVTLIESLT